MNGGTADFVGILIDAGIRISIEYAQCGETDIFWHFPTRFQQQAAQFANDRFFVNGHVYDTTPPTTSDYWCPGTMQIPSVAISEAFIKVGTLYSLINSVKAYHCPSDPTLVTFAGVQQNRVRSYSLSIFMNGNDSPPNNEVSTVVSFNGNFHDNHKSTAIKTPPPTDAIVFCEEGNSMDDGQFGFDPRLPADGGSWNWLNVPALYHGSSTAFSFADGHGEMHHWLDGGTLRNSFLNLSHDASINVADPTTDRTNITWVKTHIASH